MTPAAEQETAVNLGEPNRLAHVAPSNEWRWETTSAKNSGEASLNQRISRILLLVSLLPLLVIGLGAWHVFHGWAIDKTFELHQAIVKRHADSIDIYLGERLRALSLIAFNHPFQSLTDERHLALVFESLKKNHPDDFVDLGVFDETGKHRAYVGPYELKGKNYADAEWFNTTLENGSYVSDVFMGKRRYPHSVVSVLKEDGRHRWILRATINNNRLYSLVQSLDLGETADVFVVNRHGRCQTPGLRNKVLGSVSWKLPPSQVDADKRRIENDNEYFLRVSTWINQGRWLLVVQQSEKEILAPIRSALKYGALAVLVALSLVLAATFTATRHLTREVDRVNRQRDSMYFDLMRSAKLASLGELATGLAHEINNPLAIICAEQTNIGDVLKELPASNEVKESVASSVARSHRQIKRCGDITAKMLQFGRKNEGNLQLIDLCPLASEVTSMMSKRAKLDNIEIELDLDSSTPKVFVNATELEQVLVNLINNSLHAMKTGGKITVSLRGFEMYAELSVKDNGHGIPQKNLDKIFQPFFTTKPPGEGTGLGLAVSHGLVRAWGGSISVGSEVNVGTILTIRLPIRNF